MGRMFRNVTLTSRAAPSHAPQLRFDLRQKDRADIRAWPAIRPLSLPGHPRRYGGRCSAERCMYGGLGRAPARVCPVTRPCLWSCDASGLPLPLPRHTTAPITDGSDRAALAPIGPHAEKDATCTPAERAARSRRGELGMIRAPVAAGRLPFDSSPHLSRRAVAKSIAAGSFGKADGQKIGGECGAARFGRKRPSSRTAVRTGLLRRTTQAAGRPCAGESLQCSTDLAGPVNGRLVRADHSQV